MDLRLRQKFTGNNIDHIIYVGTQNTKGYKSFKLPKHGRKNNIHLDLFKKKKREHIYLEPFYLIQRIPPITSDPSLHTAIATKKFLKTINKVSCFQL